MIELLSASMLHGHTPMLVIVVSALAALMTFCAVAAVKAPAKHQRSIRRYQREWRE